MVGLKPIKNSSGSALIISMIAMMMISVITANTIRQVQTMIQIRDNIGRDSKVAFVKSALNQVILDPALCQVALSGQPAEAKKEIELSFGPSYATKLKKGEPSKENPDPDVASLLMGLKVKSIQLLEPIVKDPSGNYRATLWMGVKTGRAENRGDDLKNLYFPITYSATAGPNSTIIDCAEDSFIVGHCPANQYIVGLNADNTVACAEPESNAVRINLDCKKDTQYAVGYDPVKDEPICEDLPYLGKSCLETEPGGCADCRITGFKNYGKELDCKI